MHHPRFDSHVLLGSGWLQMTAGDTSDVPKAIEHGCAVQGGAGAARREPKKRLESEWGEVTGTRVAGGLTCAEVMR